MIREVSNIAALRHFLHMAIKERCQDTLFYADMHGAAQGFIRAAIKPCLLVENRTKLDVLVEDVP